MCTAQYYRLFDLLRARASSGGIPGSGLVSFIHTKAVRRCCAWRSRSPPPRLSSACVQGAAPVQVQALTFDQVFLKLVPPEHR